jgi:MraZ protein
VGNFAHLEETLRQAAGSANPGCEVESKLNSDRGLVLGEYTRTLDDRFRVTIPNELLTGAFPDGSVCILAKERTGSLSLWDGGQWKAKLDGAVNLVRAKIEAGKLTGRIDDVQRLGRLLSTRHKEVSLAGRGRLAIPEGFREFLGVEPGGEVLLVGAGVCIELWRPTAWLDYLEQKMPEFSSLLDELSG